MSGRVFIADYNRDGVLTQVYIPLGCAAILGMAGLLLANPVISLLGGFLTIFALRFWPLARHDRPALKLSSLGVEIDGIGLVKWSDISSVDKGVVQVKALKMPALDITFRRSITEVFHPSEATRLRPWEFRIFKLRSDGKIRLDLNKIQDEPDAIHEAFRYFISGER